MAVPISDKIASETPYTGPTGDPNSGPVEGVSCVGAASTDAMCRAGGTPSPYPGAALALGWSGVCGKDGHTYFVFLNGEIVGIEEGTGTTDTVALGTKYGVDSDHFGHILRLVAA